MIDPEICSGQQFAWTLIRKLGEGDAGEVYLVEAQPGGQRAILKRPRKSPFSSDVLRQSGQIETEGRILNALADRPRPEEPLPPTDESPSNPAPAPSPHTPAFHIPALLDTSLPGTQSSDRYFIVLEQAPGFDLSTLARIAMLGRVAAARPLVSPADNLYLQAIAGLHKVPEPILLSALSGLLELFEVIHTLPVETGETTHAGLIWNDVKPDHLFWDPATASLTVIDWGNGRFLEADGATQDRRFSHLDDYRQFVDEMGRFLDLTAPELKARLPWPTAVTFDTAAPQGFAVLKKKVLHALQESRKGLKKARQREAGLLKIDPEKEDPFPLMTEVHGQIVSFGEMPNYATALLFSQSYAAAFVKEDRLDTLAVVAEWAAQLPQSRPEHWRIIARIALIASTSEGERRRRFLDAIQAVVVQDWDAALWSLVAAIHDLPEPDWWYELSSAVRRQKLTLDEGSVPPMVSAKRILLALQAIIRQIEDRTGTGRAPASRPVPAQAGAPNGSTAGAPNGSSGGAPDIDRLRAIVRRLKEEILPNWLRVDPAPPFSGLVYADIDGLLDEINVAVPNLTENTVIALKASREAVDQVLSAWKRQEFILADQGLRTVLMWDPDRRRVLRADRAIISAPGWLKKVHLGPKRGENLREFATRIEFEGRELRNQVGPTDWLDLILEACKQLRRSTWPGDLLASSPQLIREMPWLKTFGRHEHTPANPAQPAAPDSPPQPAPATTAPVVIQGQLQGTLGPGADLEISEPLDAWIPEARGSSARVYRGRLRGADGLLYPAAIKLMRVDKAEYAQPLFHEEVQILNLLDDVPGVSRMFECGFIRFENGQILPDERTADSPKGSLLRIGPASPLSFQDQLVTKVRAGWVPYVALEPRADKDNLIQFCDAGHTGGRFLPLADLVRMSIQICDILQIAHERRIVYRDHKILHYYWVEEANGVYMIDWNVARYHPDGLAEFEKQMDMVQFGARALHHILTGRTAPGALPLGPTRPEEIEQAATTYNVQWTYDDQRLSEELKGILETVLAGGYTRPDLLGNDLKQAYFHLNPENG